jgi:multicomponent Na+:H+ antiporter subunit D
MGPPESFPFAIWLVLIPLAGATLAFLTGGWVAQLLGRVVGPLTALLAIGQAWQVARSGVQRYPLAGWGAPLGIDLYCDGLAAVMLLMTAAVCVPVGAFAARDRIGGPKALFWALWLFLWAALNALFLSADLFNLYVGLELLGLAAVALVALDGSRAALTSALRYLLVTLLGSLAYLLGVAICYGAFGTLDLAGLSRAVRPGPAATAAFTVMTAGLLLKAALFPLHFWLPPAHANAPTPVSAALSALVVKVPFYLLLRLRFDVFPTAVTAETDQVLGVLGAAAVLWGGCQSLLAVRLKLIVAYSTVTQMGYLFLIFPLIGAAGKGSMAWAGAVYLALAHALAKAAIFLAVGNVRLAVGHDRLGELGVVGRAIPVSMMAIALAAVSLIGLPPSGGFTAKWMLLTAALGESAWWTVAVLLAGGLLSAAYWFRILEAAFQDPDTGAATAVPAGCELMPLLLSLGVLSLGLIAVPVLELLRIGASPLTEVAP